MNGTRFCGSCGAGITTSAKFCPSCGTEQQQFAAGPEPEQPAPPAEPEAPPSEPRGEPREGIGERLGRVNRDAGDLAEELGAQLRTPGVVAAALAALIATGIVLALGLVVAVLFPDESLIGAVGTDGTVLSETFRQAVQFLQADVLDQGSLEIGPGRIAPAILLAVPIGACAFGARVAAVRTEGLPPWVRLAWAAATGVGFAFLMLFSAIAAGGGGTVEVSVGGAFGLGLVWGALGAVTGVAPAVLREAAPGPPRGAAAVALDVGVRALRPLALVLLLGALIGTGVWLYATVGDTGNVQGDRPEALAVVENGLYAAEHGVHFAELGALVEFDTPGPLGAIGLPLPVDDVSEVTGGGGDRFRIFSYKDALPVYGFIPLLVLAIPVPALLALYAGFSIARARAAPSVPLAAAWGAAVGPVWALAMALLNAITDKDLFGRPAAGSAFAAFLIGGALLGALGGLLARRASIEPENVA